MSILLTLDTDWAPDWLLEEVLSNMAGIPLVIHVTNTSSFLSHAINIEAKWELGIHPNFEKNSSHGDSIEDVFNHMRDLVPQARIWRSHSLLSSTRIRQFIAINRMFAFSSNIYDPYIKLQPFFAKYGDHETLEIPIHFEDDLIANEVAGFDRAMSQLLNLDEEKVYVFNFHPTHLFLNTHSWDEYLRMKTEIYNETPIKRYAKSSRLPGAQSLLDEVLKLDHKFLNLDELNEYAKEKFHGSTKLLKED